MSVTKILEAIVKDCDLAELSDFEEIKSMLIEILIEQEDWNRKRRNIDLLSVCEDLMTKEHQKERRENDIFDEIYDEM